MNDTTIFLLISGDLIVGLLIWLYMNKYFNTFTWWKSALIKSLVYSLFFGIGAFGEGGGDPGFMLPVPILPAAIFSLADNKFYVFIHNALLPYGIWTLILFVFYCIREIVRKWKKTRPFT